MNTAIIHSYSTLALCTTYLYINWLLHCSADLIMIMIGMTSACVLKLFRNSVALEKDEEQVSFINMRIKALWECPDQDEEVGAKHIAEGERSKRPPVSLFLHWLVNRGSRCKRLLKTLESHVHFFRPNE